MDIESNPELKIKLVSFYNDTFSEFIKDSDIKSYEKLISLWTDFQKIHTEASNTVLQMRSEQFTGSDSNSATEKIEARSVIVEVTDRETGIVYRRDLPLKYYETDNGIILSGETSDGKPSDITFLSDTAIERINDLTGKGPDTPRCGH